MPVCSFVTMFADVCHALEAIVSGDQSWVVLQALGVSAESDGLEPTRTESRPFGDFGGGLALSWWSILLICLSGILLLGIAARIWRRQTQRLLRSVVAVVCRNPRYSQFKDVRIRPLS